MTEKWISSFSCLVALAIAYSASAFATVPKCVHRVEHARSQGRSDSPAILANIPLNVEHASVPIVQKTAMRVEYAPSGQVMITDHIEQANVLGDKLLPGQEILTVPIFPRDRRNLKHYQAITAAQSLQIISDSKCEQGL